MKPDDEKTQQEKLEEEIYELEKRIKNTEYDLANMFKGNAMLENKLKISKESLKTKKDSLQNIGKNPEISREIEKSIDIKENEPAISKEQEEEIEEEKEEEFIVDEKEYETKEKRVIGELIEELRKRGKTSFLVTNGLYPEKIKELINKKQLPTQLYVSVNAPNKELYSKFHRSSIKNAWEKFNETLNLMPKLKKQNQTLTSSV